MHCLHLDSVDSTNNEAKRRLRAGQWSGDGYILSREQTEGRGRYGRRWSSPRDAGIYCSCILHCPTCENLDPELLTRAAAVAAAHALQECVGVSPLLKPVNDLYLRVPGRDDPLKLGGILVECLWEASRPESIVIGVGINLRRAVHVMDDSLSDDNDTAVGDENPPPSDRVIAAACLEDAVPVTPDIAVALRESIVQNVFKWSRIAVSNDRHAVEIAWSRFEQVG